MLDIVYERSVSSLIKHVGISTRLLQKVLQFLYFDSLINEFIISNAYMYICMVSALNVSLIDFNCNRPVHAIGLL